MDRLYRWTWCVVFIAILAVWGFAFFFWHFMSWLSPFIAPSLWIVVIAIALVALGFSIVLPLRRWRVLRFASLFPLIALTVVLVSSLYIDFTELWLDVNFAVGRSVRERIVRQVAAGDLRPNVDYNRSLIHLPARYHELSLGGGDIMIEGSKVFFFTYRGILDNFAGFIYCPDDVPPVSGAFGGEFFIEKKMADRWYYVSAR